MTLHGVEDFLEGTRIMRTTEKMLKAKAAFQSAFDCPVDQSFEFLEGQFP
ncbi:MAG: hypothetical protein JNM70_02355 [Anaerolineae bacterium]|nr:hypothetical protein [Anaerolineae bacterium]